MSLPALFCGLNLSKVIILTVAELEAQSKFQSHEPITGSSYCSVIFAFRCANTTSAIIKIYIQWLISSGSKDTLLLLWTGWRKLQNMLACVVKTDGSRRRTEQWRCTGSPRSLSLSLRLWIFWSWSASSIRRSSCSFLDSCTSVCNFAFSVCRMATVLVDEASCCSSSAWLSDKLFASSWTDNEEVRKVGLNDT